SDPACLRIANEGLNLVFPRQQRKAGIVRVRPPGQLRGGRVAELYVYLVPNVGNSTAEFILDLRHEIEQGMFRAAALGQGQFASRDLDFHRREVFSTIQLEKIDLH